MVIAIFGCIQLTSCVSSARPEPLASDEKSQAAPSLEADLVEAETLESPPRIEDALGEQFCKDDIYASYLRKQHFDDLTASLTSIRQVNERKGVQRNREVLAIHHARSRIQGPTENSNSLPVVSNAQVESWIRYFTTRGRQTLLRWMIRAESAQELMLPILAEQGMPPEFIYLAMIESGFVYTARSHARAVGPWQFMLPTARLYGLRVNHWVDERRDPEKATYAASSYLKDLYDQFGDWHLAMAAYNAGPGRIRGAIRRGGTSDFWQLAERGFLPRETQNYVPKILAAIIIASNLEAYGFAVAANPNDLLPNTTAFLPRPVRLQELASQLGVSVSDIRKWNPELINDITPPLREEQTTYHLRLPPRYAQSFKSIEANLAYLEIRDVQMHRVQQGETLSHIARRYRVSIRDIMNVNPRIQPTRLRIGREIAIPIPGIREAKRDEQKLSSPKSTG